MKYAVVSYWVGETGDTKLWLYDTEDAAKEALNRLWEQSYNLALEDEDFDEDNSYHEDYFAVVAWKDELYRYFKVVKQRRSNNMSKIYKAEYADEEMEIFSYCDNDTEAMKEAESYEEEHGTLFNLFEVDENYDEVRTIF